MFWTIESDGLYRLDLQDVSNGVKHEVEPTLIFNKSDTKAFTIDYIRFKILVVSETNNTVFAVDLDGKKFEDCRSNTQMPQFNSVKSIAYANAVFYWTSGAALLNEEYHVKHNNYYHNSFPDYARVKNFLSIHAKLPSAQPIPVPINPPSNVQAILSRRRGKVSWNVPHLLGIQGRGAWQDWSYQLEISDEGIDGRVRLIQDIKGLDYVVDNLSENQGYMIRVAAYTSAGVGPFSTEFHSRTLKTLHDRSLIWSSEEGLVQSDILAERVDVLIPRESLHYKNITNIAWLGDSIYFVCDSMLHLYNRATMQLERLDLIPSVETFAIDWVGKRLYWCNPMSQLIFRGTLEGREAEPVIPIAATDIKIDAIRGYIYYASGNLVGYSRLNGKERNEFFRKDSFAARRVMGLTLDLEDERVYWIIRGYDDSSLVSAPLVGSASDSPKQEYRLMEKAIQGPLTYFSDRLLWLQDDQTVVISNMTGKSLAYIKNLKLSELKAFTVIDPTLQADPYNGVTDINVIPEPVDPETIQTSGSYKRFNITWQPVQTVNFGEVFYRVEATYHLPQETRDNFFQSNENVTIPPFSLIDFNIRAFTYWGSSQVVNKQLRSPAAPPSAPMRPRMFITHEPDPIHGDVKNKAIFRWDPPIEKNGPLAGYVLNCWYEHGRSNFSILEDAHISADETDTTLEERDPNTIYSCQVHAASTAGSGERSRAVSIRSDELKPIPQLYIASGDEISILDLDARRSATILIAGSNVLYLAYIAFGDQLIYVNDNKELMMFVQGSKQRLHMINATAVSLTVDWVERRVYWAQLEHQGSSIHSFDLTRMRATPLLSRPGYLTSLHAEPLHRLLFWIESDKKFSPGEIKYYHLDTHALASFQNEINETVKTHNNVLLFDSTSDDLRIIWSRDTTSLLWSDFKTGASGRYDLSFFASLMLNFIKDSTRFYWNSGGKVKSDSALPYNSTVEPLHEMNIPKASILLALPEQRYPPARCLVPHKHFTRERSIALHEARERSLVIRLPYPRKNDGCSVHPLGLEYEVLFREFAGAETNCTTATCSSINTYEREVEVVGLKPFTKYQFQVSVSNFYAAKRRIPRLQGPPFVFETKTGAPSSPRNVSAETISPTEALVRWLPPLEFNGPSVWYEIHWQTQNAINGVKNQQQLLVSNQSVGHENQTESSVLISRLLPDQPYSVWVRVHTSNTTFNQSEPVEIVTLPEPEKITLVNATSQSLTIFWRPYDASRFVIECWAVEHDLYRTTATLTSDNITDLQGPLEIKGLVPKTDYLFTMSLHFPKRSEPYVWPEDGRKFLFQTLADRPSPPGRPQVIQLPNDIFQVRWLAAMENGAAIEEYSLEAVRYRAKRERRSKEPELVEDDSELQPIYSTSMATSVPLSTEELDPIADDWKVYYNGTDTYWIVDDKDLEPVNMYTFRVRARNLFGWSEFSKDSESLGAPIFSSENREFLIMAGVAPVVVITLIIAAACIIRGKRKPQRHCRAFSSLFSRFSVPFECIGEESFPGDARSKC